MANILGLILMATDCWAQASEPVALDQASSLMRKGLFRAAETLLQPLSTQAGGHSEDPARAHADLLLGNIAFERGDYEAALQRYEAVVVNPRASEGLSAAARSNVERSGALLARARALKAEARRLAWAVTAAALLGVGTCGWLARARPRNTTGPA
jgi:tetratricopeptide (TPR) repeat protein